MERLHLHCLMSFELHPSGLVFGHAQKVSGRMKSGPESSGISSQLCSACQACVGDESVQSRMATKVLPHCPHS